jgi:hypothetical protein
MVVPGWYSSAACTVRSNPLRRIARNLAMSRVEEMGSVP